MKKGERTRIVLLTLFLAVFCLWPFVVAPLKDWYIILILFGVPTTLVFVFGLISNKVGLSSKPKLKSALSYMVVWLAMFCLSAIFFYLSNYSWLRIFLDSAGFSFLAVIAGTISTFVWRKIKQLEKTNLTQ